MSFLNTLAQKYKVVANITVPKIKFTPNKKLEKTEYDVSFRLTTEKEKDIKQDITKEFCKAIKQALDAQSDIELTNAIIESGINVCYTEMYGEMDIAHVYQYLKKNLNLSKIVEDVYLLIKETELTGDSSHDINLVGQNTIFHDKLN